MSPLNRTRGDSGSGLQGRLRRCEARPRATRAALRRGHQPRLDAVECSNRGADVDKRPTCGFPTRAGSHGNKDTVPGGSDPDDRHRLCARRSTIWTVTKWPRWNTPWHDTLVCDGRRICKWATDLALRWSCRESNPGPTAFPQGFSVRSSLCLCSDLPVTRTSRDDDPSRCGCPEESRDRTHRWIPLADARVRAEGVPGLTD